MPTPPRGLRVHRLARGVVVVAVCLSLGLQWAALQGIAWTSMLINYSKDGSLVEAVSKTFDGAHPCALCQMVEEGRDKPLSPSTPEAKPAGKKMDAVLAAMSVLIAPQGVRLEFPAWQPRTLKRVTAPPSKPPRTGLA